MRLSRGQLDQIYPVSVHQSLTAPRLINYLFYWLSVSGCGSSLKVHFIKNNGIISHAKIQILMWKKDSNRETMLFFSIWDGNLDFVPETGQVANERGRKRKELGSCEQSPTPY